MACWPDPNEGICMVQSEGETEALEDSSQCMVQTKGDMLNGVERETKLR